MAILCDVWVFRTDWLLMVVVWPRPPSWQRMNFMACYGNSMGCVGFPHWLALDGCCAASAPSWQRMNFMVSYGNSVGGVGFFGSPHWLALDGCVASAPSWQKMNVMVSYGNSVGGVGSPHWLALDGCCVASAPFLTENEFHGLLWQFYVMCGFSTLIGSLVCGFRPAPSWSAIWCVGFGLAPDRERISIAVRINTNSPLRSAIDVVCNWTSVLVGMWSSYVKHSGGIYQRGGKKSFWLAGSLRYLDHFLFMSLLLRVGASFLWILDAWSNWALLFFPASHQ
jgi:hypothetical protein